MEMRTPLSLTRLGSGQGPTGTRPSPHITLPVGAGGGPGYRWKALVEPVVESQKSREESQTTNFGHLHAAGELAPASRAGLRFSLASIGSHVGPCTEENGLVATALAALGHLQPPEGRTARLNR